MSSFRIVRLSAGGGPVEVEIVIGHAHFGRYELSLFDSQGRNPIVIGAGLTHDEVPDRFAIAHDPLVLQGRFLSWSANIIPMGDEPDPEYSVRLHIRQNGVEVPDSPVEVSGRIDGPRVEFGFARLEVA